VNPLASTFITSALIFYSVGVWGERITGRLRWWNFKKDEAAIKNFHKFSVFVWAVWLIPYLSPMFLAIAK
jgi:hypothetical protein